MGQVSAGVRKPRADAESCRQHRSQQPPKVSVHPRLSHLTGQSHTELYSKERATQANPMGHFHCHLHILLYNLKREGNTESIFLSRTVQHACVLQQLLFSPMAAVSF